MNIVLLLVVVLVVDVDFVTCIQRRYIMHLVFMPDKRTLEGLGLVTHCDDDVDTVSEVPHLRITPDTRTFYSSRQEARTQDLVGLSSSSIVRNFSKLSNSKFHTKISVSSNKFIFSCNEEPAYILWPFVFCFVFAQHRSSQSLHVTTAHSTRRWMCVK